MAREPKRPRKRGQGVGVIIDEQQVSFAWQMNVLCGGASVGGRHGEALGRLFLGWGVLRRSRRLCGLPLERRDELTHWVHTFFHGASAEEALVLRAVNGRDLWHLNRGAPRLLQPAPSGDFAVQTRCGCFSDGRTGLPSGWMKLPN